MEVEDRALAKQLGERVRSEREELHWPQSLLAEKMGVSVGYVSLIERGERLPSTPMLARLARELGVPAGDLLDPIPSSRGANWLVEAHRLLERVPPDMAPLILTLIRGVLETARVSDPPRT